MLFTERVSDELTLMVLQELNAYELVCLRTLCSRAENVTYDRTLWVPHGEEHYRMTIEMYHCIVPELAPGNIHATSQATIEGILRRQYVTQRWWLSQHLPENHRILFEWQGHQMSDLRLLPLGRYFFVADRMRRRILFVNVSTKVEVEVTDVRGEHDWVHYRHAYSQEDQVVYCGAAKMDEQGDQYEGDGVYTVWAVNLLQAELRFVKFAEVTTPLSGWDHDVKHDISADSLVMLRCGGGGARWKMLRHEFSTNQSSGWCDLDNLGEGIDWYHDTCLVNLLQGYSLVLSTREFRIVRISCSATTGKFYALTEFAHTLVEQNVVPVLESLRQLRNGVRVGFSDGPDVQIDVSFDYDAPIHVKLLRRGIELNWALSEVGAKDCRRIFGWRVGVESGDRLLGTSRVVGMLVSQDPYAGLYALHPPFRGTRILQIRTTDPVGDDVVTDCGAYPDLRKN